MSSTNSRRPEPCAHENCGSRRFHDGDDGFTYCDRGHQQSERGALVTQDTGELVLKGRTFKRKGSDAESTTSRASGFSGPRALEHYLLCLQLVLRKQLRWLIEVKKLPEELEALVRDLWALRLQKLQKRVSYDLETETETQSHFYSSQSEGETSASEASRRSRSRLPGQTRIEGTPNLHDLLALCYTGCLFLREPVTVADLYAWCNNGELLYYRAGQEVPMGMRERLPPIYQELLEPKPLGKPEKLQHTMLGVLTTLNTEFDMALPPINHPLILHRWTRELALPIEVFAATSRLADMLDMDFAWKLDGKAGTKDVMLRYPEARLMALLVVAAKLLFPFDDIKRYPASASDMSALSMDWTGWAGLRSTSVDRVKQDRTLDYKAALDFPQNDVLDASEEQLDQYMNWFEHNISSENIRERGRAGREADFRRTLFRTFPAHSNGSLATASAAQTAASSDGEVELAERIRTVQASLNPKQVFEAEAGGQADVHRIGSFYRRFKTSEALDGPVKVFYQYAAEAVGLSIDGMVRAVLLAESKMKKCEERLRRGGG